ncbi:MAG: sialidase family protein [Candidatus Sumerlaeota bacterium]
MTTNLVTNGGAVFANATVTGTWTSSGGVLSATGTNAYVAANSGVGTGDFTITAVLHITSATPTQAALVIDGVADFGLTATSAKKIYVRGFFFGDMTQELNLLSDFAAPGDDVTVVCKRTGDTVQCFINGTVIWEMPYEADREFGKIAIRAGSTQLGIKQFSFDGATTSLTGWVSPYVRPHPLRAGSVDVYTGGSGGYNTYRIPALACSNAGTLLAICEGRKASASDSGDIDLLVKRSTDGGATWGPAILAYEEGGTATITIGNPCPVVDKSTGTIWLMFCRNTARAFIGKSTDDGLTWAPRVEITSTVAGAGFGTSIHSGPGHGFQHGSGRLMFPSYHNFTSGGSTSYMIYSDDHGATFAYGGDVGLSSGEPAASLLSDGKVLMNSRAPRRVWQRIVGTSDNIGGSWMNVAQNATLVEPTCQGSMLSGFAAPETKTVLFANPNSTRRERMRVKLSNDDGATWTDTLSIYEGSAAYSDIVQVAGDHFGVLFERNGYANLTFSPFSLADFPTRQTSGIKETALWVLR